MGPEHPPPPINDQPIKPLWTREEGPANSCPRGGALINHTGHDIAELTSSQAKICEESTKKALLLKRKELRWKLMQASQAQNQAKLTEIKTSLNYHKQKLTKAQALAVKLRDKYVKVVQSAKVTETQLRDAESQLARQEKYVADEKMQLTKLAIECTKTGTSLYGSSYKLPENPTALKIAKARYSALNTYKQKFQQPRDVQSGVQDNPIAQENKEEILKNLSPFLRRAREVANVPKDNTVETEQPQDVVIDLAEPFSIRPNMTLKKRKQPVISRLSSLYDLNDSVLKNLASYRLTRKFAEIGTTKLTDTAYSHIIRPLEYTCLPDLLSECPDKSCPYQHKSNYYMTDLEILTDLLSYQPKVAGWIRSDVDLDEEENYRICRIKLKQYAAKLISKNADKSVELLARAIVRDIRATTPDLDLLLSHRLLPKANHLDKNYPVVCPCEAVGAPNQTTSDTKNANDQTHVVEMNI